MDLIAIDPGNPSTELSTDAPSPLHLRKREIGCKKFSVAKWRRPLEENRLSSIKIVGMVPVIFTSRAAATSLDIDRNESDFLLAGSSKGSIDIVNLRYAHLRSKEDKPAIQAKYSHGNMINSVQWYSENISLFATSSQDGTVKIWDLNRQKPFDTYPIDNPKQMHWNEISRRNPLIAVTDTTSNVILIDVRKGNSAQNIRNKTAVASVRWYQLENLLCTGDFTGILYYWDIRNSRKPLREKPICKPRQISAIRFTSDGLYLICVDAFQLFVYILDAITLEVIMGCKVIDEKIERPHPNSRNICVVEEGKLLRVCVPVISEKFAWISFDLEKRKIIRHQLMSGHMNTVSACAYRTNYQQLITASNGMIVNWSSEGERAKASLEMESSYQQAREDNWSDSD